VVRVDGDFDVGDFKEGMLWKLQRKHVEEEDDAILNFGGSIISELAKPNKPYLHFFSLFLLFPIQRTCVFLCLTNK